MKKIGWLLAAMAAMAAALSGCTGGWRASSRDSAGIAPLPQAEPRAVVQVYAANVWGWRGWFADHTWIAAKPEGGGHYTVYEVIGWRTYRGRPAVRIANDVPDRKWFGAAPRLLADLRGAVAAKAAEKIAQAARSYPYPNEYRAFPGPNSNTFTAWIAREVPELNLKLPLRAVGKSYPLDGR